LLFDDATSILHTVVITFEVNITSSIGIEIWQMAVDIIWEIALIRPVVHRSLPVDDDWGVSFVPSS
jgi:hypothetical protein